MSALVLDTNVVSYLMRDHSLAQKYRRHLEGQTLAVSFMTVGELYEGAFRANWSSDRMRGLEATIRTFLVIPSSSLICQTWGHVRSVRRHQPISAQDAWVASTALAYSLPLVTHNPSDFGGIPNLQIITEN